MELEREVKVAYTKLVTISVDPVDVTKVFKERLGASFPMLCDPERVWQKELDLQEYTDTRHDPFLPYAFMLEPGLVIYKIYNGYWFWGRPTQEDLRQDFRAMSMRCRPDWDPQAPGVREAWEEARAEGIRMAPDEFRERIAKKRKELGI